LGAAGHGVHDQSQSAARLQHVVDGLGHALFVGPVEGLAEGDEPVRARRGLGELLGEGADPRDVSHVGFQSGRASFGQHVRIRVQANDVGEESTQP
jgi:hypothetical protein